MTPGFQNLARALVPVPEGHPRIAQRFSVGSTHGNKISPEGTAENAGHFGRPFGTCSLIGAAPNAEALGYFQSSLRDEDLQILVALGATPALHWVSRPASRLGPSANSNPSRPTEVPPLHARSACPPRLQTIQRAFHAAASLAQDVRVNHGRGDVILAQQLMDGPNIRASPRT